eukprot:3019237-Pyramimonas_sp.AAC.1
MAARPARLQTSSSSSDLSGGKLLDIREGDHDGRGPPQRESPSRTLFSLPSLPGTFGTRTLPGTFDTRRRK